MGTPIKDATPIRRVYHINEKLPDGVRVSKTSVQDGDTFEIAYFTSGCAPTILRFTAGNRYKHFTYSGDEIIVHDAKTAGVTLQRRIRLNVMSEDGRPVTGLQVWCNDQSCGVKDGYVTLSSPDAHGAYHVTVGAYGYKPKKLHLTDDNINRGIVHVSLKTDIVTVPVRLHINGTIIEDQVSLKGNSPLLPYLKEAQGDELNKHKFNTVYGADGRPMSGDGKKENNGKGKHPAISKKTLVKTSTLLAAMYIFYAIGALIFGTTPWPFGADESKQSGIEQFAANNTYYENETVQQPNTDTQENLARDMTWMKEHYIWTKDSLLTQKYQTLCDYIANGQVEKIMNKEPWFDMADTNHYNKHWRHIIMLLNEKDKNPKIMKHASEYMIELSNGGKIKIGSICFELCDEADIDFKEHYNNNNRKIPSNKIRKLL